MIPSQKREVVFTQERLPETTFFLDEETGRVSGRIDGHQAAMQAARLILETERYQYLIYSEQYGTELASLLGQPEYVVFSELKRRVTEALTQDDRITGISEFSLQRSGDRWRASFLVHTVYGEERMPMEVAIH